MLGHRKIHQLKENNRKTILTRRSIRTENLEPRNLLKINKIISLWKDPSNQRNKK